MGTQDQPRGPAGAEPTRSAGSPGPADEGSAPEGLLGRRIGHIHIVGSLGRGGMGEVYVGMDETLQRRVAVKAIRARSRLHAAAKSRFLREARVLSQLDHPNICRIYDYVEGNDADLLVLELVDGSKLSDLIAKGLDHATKLRISSQIAEALQAAHAEGIVHRDLKPDNVMLTRAGVVKVLDFGLAFTVLTGPGAPSGGAITSPRTNATPTVEPDPAASVTQPPEMLAGEDEALTLTELRSDALTRVGTVVGSPSYMSPEQARGEPVTTASDMYSFGLLLQTLFTGRSPYPSGMDLETLMRRARRGKTLPPKVGDKTVEELIVRLKALAPARRPTALATAERLAWIRDRPKRRTRRLVVAATAALLLFGGVRYTVDVRAARDIAELRQQQAEDLIGFMLGDLRQRLREVNRLDIMDEVADKSLEYFAAVPERELSEEELVRRSTALMHIAQVRILEGDTEAGLHALERSLPVAEELAARQPERVEWQLNLAEQHFWTGRVHWERGELDLALARFRSQLEVARRATARHPDDWDLRSQLAFALHNIAFVEEGRGNLDAALTVRRESLDVVRALAAERPDDPEALSEVADGENALAVTLGRLGRFDEALEHLRLQRELLEAEGPLPEDAPRRGQLQINTNLQGRLLLDKGELVAARELFSSALETARSLVERDPTNASQRRELAISQVLLGEADLLLGEPAAAQQLFSEATGSFEELLARDATRVGAKRDLARAAVGLGWSLLDQGNPSAAAARARSALATLEPVVDGDTNSSDPRSREQLCEALLLLGESLQASGDREGASSAYRRAVAVVEPVARDSGDADLMGAWARALTRAGRDDEAEPLRARLGDLGYDLSRFPRP